MSQQIQHHFDLCKSFARAAKTYDRYAGFQRTVADDVTERLDGNFASVTKILDVGCGTGYAAERFRFLGYQKKYFGVDFSFEMSKKSRLKAGDSQTYFVQADGHHLPFSDNKFDLVTSFLVLHWCQLEGILGELFRVLRPRSRAVLSLMGKRTYQELKAVLKNTLRLDDEELSRYLPSFYDTGQVENCVRKSGWREFNVSSKIYTGEFPDVMTFVKHLKGTGTHVNSLKAYTGLGGRRFLRRVEEEYLKIASAKNGISVTREVIFVRAIK